MKKILVLFGLFVCTTGLSYANEIPNTNKQNLIQQVGIQNQLDKQTFDRDKFNAQNHCRKYSKNNKNCIKYDKSVKNRTFKNSKPKTDH